MLTQSTSVDEQDGQDASGSILFQSSCVIGDWLNKETSRPPAVMNDKGEIYICCIPC